MAHMPDGREFHPSMPPEPPASLEAEQALLGAILTNNEAIDLVPFLEPEHFYDEFHQEVFTSIRAKHAIGRRADWKILFSEFRDAKVGDMNGGQYLAQMASSALPIVLARDYGLEIMEAHVRRQGIEDAAQFRDALQFKRSDQLVSDLIGVMEDRLAGLRALAPTVQVRSSIASHLDGLMANLSDAGRSDRTSIPFALPEIGSILQEDGFEPGNLYGLVGSSGEGKTSLELQIVRAAAEAGHPVFLMSYDQNGIQVARQMISQSTGITYGQMRRRGGMNDREWQMVHAEEERFRKLPIDIARLRQEKIGRICALARGFAKRMQKVTDKAPLIVLDHNRKVTPDRPNDHEGRIAASINGAGKALAEEIGAAVLYMCQRNGSGLKRDVPRPIAADLFGGEGAREDFDAILYLYRAEKWRDERLKIAGSESERIKIRERFRIGGEDPEGRAELGAIKVRYGNDNVREIVRWEGPRTRYVSMRDDAGLAF